MIDFPSGILRTLGVANKANAGELYRPLEADVFALDPRLGWPLFRHKVAPSLSVNIERHPQNSSCWGWRRA
jgi:hypothetical protein